MSTDADIASEIDQAFGECPKPEHFGNHTHCGECAEHDQLLRDRTRETLTIEDVGSIGWDPICYSDSAGIAYYFPTLARLAISSRTYEYGWYGDHLLMHLTRDGSDNSFLRFCSVEQRRAVGHLLRHLHENLPENLPGRQMPLMDLRDIVEARTLWTEP
jgi:hypothetical protein